MHHTDVSANSNNTVEKIKKYNQVLLALFGTLTFIFALIGGLFLLTQLYRDIFPDPQVGEEGVRIIESSDFDLDATQSKKFQEVTYLDPVQLDSGLAELIIPVSQVNLEVPENVRGTETALLDSYESSNFIYMNYYGFFNNFLLYNNEVSTYDVIFDFKASLNHWAYLKFKNRRLLIFQGTSIDSNEDGFLNHKDFQQLYIYHLSDSTLIKLEIPNATVVKFDPMAETNLISVRIGIDKNEDKEFDELRESYRLFRYNVDSREYSEFVPESLNKTIQKLIEN